MSTLSPKWNELLASKDGLTACKVCGDNEIVDLLPEDFAKIKPYLDAGLNKYEDGEEIDTMRPCPCCSREGMLITAEELSPHKKNLLPAQQSNLDEFTFFLPAGSTKLEAWYAEEKLSVWNGDDWEEPKPTKRYNLPVVYTTTGWVEIEAENLEDAKTKARKLQDSGDLNQFTILDATSDYECMVDQMEEQS